MPLALLALTTELLLKTDFMMPLPKKELDGGGDFGLELSTTLGCTFGAAT